MGGDDYVVDENGSWGNASEALAWYREQLAKNRVALEFYAEKKNWNSPSTGFSVQYDPEQSAVDKDRGEIARAALSDKSSEPKVLDVAGGGL